MTLRPAVEVAREWLERGMILGHASERAVASLAALLESERAAAASAYSEAVRESLSAMNRGLLSLSDPQREET